MKKNELEKKQDEAVKEFIEREVLTCLDSHATYAGKVDNWTKRFEAVRSIQGMDYGEDPDKSPKLEPWKWSSDIGIPIEAITLRAIIARFVKTIFTKPICNVAGRGQQDKQAAKVVEEYNSYSLEDEMNFERQYYDILMDVGLAGDGIGKLIEADEEYEWEETYFTLIQPGTEDEPIPDPSTKNEFDAEDWPNGYPIEVAEDFEPTPDVQSGLIPEVREITITKKDKTFFGTKLIPVDPKDLVLPDNADNWDYNELPWIGHKLRKNWHWLKDRVGERKEGGYDEEIVDKLKPVSDGEKVSTVPKLNLLEVWGRVDMPMNVNETKTKVREIIALFETDKNELLGWIPNPYKGKRMFFHWQIMPMPHRARGKSIAEFARGIRDLVDSLLNNMVNRDTINAHPPFVFDEESGFDPEVHSFGPNEFWGVTDKTRLGRLDMGNYSEARSQWIIEFTMNLLQRLFGVTDYTTGSANNDQNKTARGIMAIIGEGNFSFDTMIALLQMTNKKFFEANILMHAKMMREAGMEKKVFYVTEDQNNPFREISKHNLSEQWNFIPRGTSIENNVYARKRNAGEAYGLLSKNPFFSMELTPTTANNLREITQDFVDAYELQGIVLPDKETIEKEMIDMQAKVQQKMQQDQQLAHLKSVAKLKRGTPEGDAAAKVLADIELQKSGGMGANGGAPAGGPQGPQNQPAEPAGIGAAQ